MKQVEGRKQFYASVQGLPYEPDQLIGRIIANYARLSAIAPVTMGVEIVQFQEFLRTCLKKRLPVLVLPLAVKELRNTAPKPLRINSMAPLVADETIKIHASDHLLIEELESYP